MRDMPLGRLAGYPLSPDSTPSTVTQMSSSVSSVTSSRACCENGRPIMTDPHTGQTICSCQYGTALLNYSRVQGLPEGVYGASAAAYAAGAAQGYLPLGSEGSAFYSPLANPAFDMKEGSEAWRALAAQSGGCFPYDPSMALYPYGSSYGGLDLNARRKNATRETTNTLKAWLYEHRKNPYPTKGEKIMLAIITKMTLTQVSTWFANARRRLKKENKMTWSPRNRSEDDASGDEDMDSTKGTGLESDGSNLNASLDESHDGRSDRENLDRIISVDDDETDHSDLGELDDIEPCKDSEISCFENKENNESRLNTSSATIPSQSSSNDTKDTENNKISRLGSDSNESIGNNNHDSDGEQQSSRPKIWSVIDVLGNKDNSNSKTTAQNSPPAVVCSRQANGPSFLNIHQTNQHFRSGQFPVGYNGYPLSLSHTTLSYPYTLSASTASKADINMKHAHAAALRATEQAFKEGLTDKAARMQSRIFSPARELDGLRVGGKMVL